MTVKGTRLDWWLRVSNRIGFSPVVKITTIRLVLSISASEDLHLVQLGVKTAFLHGDLDEDIYMTQTEAFQSAGKEENLVCKLKKSLYELKQAPRQWVLIFVEDYWNEEPCRDVHQVGGEREVEVLCSFSWPLSELITEDGVLPERGYSQFNDVSSGYLKLYTVQRPLQHLPYSLATNLGYPGRLVAGDRFPGRHVAQDKWNGKARMGFLPGRHRRAHIVSVKQLSVTVEGFPGRHVARDAKIN
ncbi:retrovirus-related pol polyprotein from transposon TNT 1-94 [Tanacetum coccineum]